MVEALDLGSNPAAGKCIIIFLLENFRWKEGPCYMVHFFRIINGSVFNVFFYVGGDDL